ncbi:hypothetical protein FQN57_006563 [Myotisia sp. PD_48]|nr:hypothetical protein FQN57_006563 [Myotisia sp. PD_48]
MSASREEMQSMRYDFPVPATPSMLSLRGGGSLPASQEVVSTEAVPAAVNSTALCATGAHQAGGRSQPKFDLFDNTRYLETETVDWHLEMENEDSNIIVPTAECFTVHGQCRPQTPTPQC